MKNDKKRILVHRTPKGIMQSVHRAYGLMILGGGTGLTTPVDSFYCCGERYFEHYSISHMYDGLGRVQFGSGPEIEVRPGDAIVVTPGTVNRYGGCGGQAYIEDSLTFFGPVADMMKKAGVIRDGVFAFGKVRRLPPIQQYQRDPAHASQIKANIELQKLLTDLYFAALEPVADYPLFEKLLTEIKADPGKWWTVSEMAELCRLSDDQLRRLFLRYTGCRPKLYLDRLKLRRAGELLTSTTLNVSEIAAMLGYLDPYHFSRRFKAVMGLAPGQYRDNAPRMAGGLSSGLRQ